MNTQDQIVTALNAPIPREVIRTRDNNGFELSYLEGWHVINQMNQIFGPGTWMYRISSLDKTFEGQDNKGRNTTSYIARVALQVSFPSGQTVVFEDVGYGDGMDKYSPGKAHELATKEAVTDAIKRCAKNLGMSMGLALYDKEQRYVKETEEQRPVQNKTGVPSGQKPEPAKTSTEYEVLVATINQTAKVLDKRGIRTLDAIRGELQSKYGVKTARELTETDAKDFLAVLEEGLK